MPRFPDAPFFTESFSPRGGGVDFLGLRWVNLTIVGQYLIPGLNNVTQDMGTFLLGAWIPWKFRQLAGQQKQFTEKNYRLFRERIETAISYQMRDQAESQIEHGAVRNKVGKTQKLTLPGKLTFASAKRNQSNTLFAAAIYGPSLTYLRFISSYTVSAEDGSTLRIPWAAEDDEAQMIFEAIDKELGRAGATRRLLSLDFPNMDQKDLDTIGLAGLIPSYYRKEKFSDVKAAFRQRLLPDDPQASGYARAQTSRLILETLKQKKNLTADELRDSWYTGMLPGGRRLQVATQEYQRSLWSLFMARQYQKLFIETFMWAFERALAEGRGTIDAVVDYWMEQPCEPSEGWPKTFEELLGQVRKSAGISKALDDHGASDEWNRTIHSEHECFEGHNYEENENVCLWACRGVAGWYWRMLTRAQAEKENPLMGLGGDDRLGMSWFVRWLSERRNMPLKDFLQDAFGDLVFSQHMRIALSRFDDEAQRIRFMLGDSGIEPTEGAMDIGERPASWMPDRLGALIALLTDCDVLQQDDEGRCAPGKTAAEISSRSQV